jgi:hypothetical protein
MYAYTHDEDYAKWLKKRERDAEQFGVQVDNSRPNIINISMVDLLSGRPSYFGVGKIEDDEAALWMSKNIPEIEYTIHQRAMLIDILETDIRRAEAKPDGRTRISIEKMREMIEILKKPPAKRPPVAALVSESAPAPAAAAAAGAAAAAPAPDPLSILMTTIEAQSHNLTSMEYLAAMNALKILYNKGSHGGFPRRIKNTKKKHSIKSRKSRKSRKMNSRRH